jgi:hypothetical protein
MEFFKIENRQWNMSHICFKSMVLTTNLQKCFLVTVPFNSSVVCELIAVLCSVLKAERAELGTLGN